MVKSLSQQGDQVLQNYRSNEVDMRQETDKQKECHNGQVILEQNHWKNGNTLI